LHYASLEISLDAPVVADVLMGERRESFGDSTRHQYLEQYVRTLGFISRATQYAATSQLMIEVN
jgi:hypothetical protein